MDVTLVAGVTIRRAAWAAAGENDRAIAATRAYSCERYV
jgi:hypothetical protein